MGPGLIQQKIWEAIRQVRNLADLPGDFLEIALGGETPDEKELLAATSSVFAELFYRVAKKLEISDPEQRALEKLQQSLQLQDETVVNIRYRVALTIYRRRFQSFVEDGEVSAIEFQELESIAEFFGIHKRDARKAISQQALAYYSFQLTSALNDGELTDQEMQKLAATARKLGLTSKQLKSISVPNKKEILSTALASIKGRGEIDDSDFDYIRSVAEYLNADDLLKPCLMDLELYQRLFAVRTGDLPILASQELILEPGEKLHYQVDVMLETASGGKTRRESGTLYIGSMRLRFVGLKRSQETRYRSVLSAEVKIQKQSKLILKVGSGGGGGTFRLKKSDPGILIEVQEAIKFLVRKAKGMECDRERDSRYIRADVRSEVWHRDGARCVLCGAKEYLEFDHIIPHSKGGATSVDNLQLLCRSCNSQKSDNI